MPVNSAPVAGSAASAPGARGIAIGVALILGLLAGWLSSWWAGAAVFAFALVLVARPFDLFVSLLLLAAVAAFARYGDPSIQKDLFAVSALTFYALASLFVAALTGRWTLPSSPLGDALMALAVTSALAGLHGVLAHHSFRFIVLELLPLFALLLALAIGGTRLRPADLRIAKWALVGVALVSSAIGYQYYATTGTRTQGMPFSPVPGFIAIVVLTLMLFEPSRRPRFWPIVVFCVLIGHQIITFTRGFWLALLVAVPFACALYVRRGEGMGRRWRKVMGTLGLVAIVLLPMAAVASTLVGWSEIMDMIGSRFASSFQTKNTPETVSNIVRLVELRTTMKFILEQPLLGYGHGATLIVRQFFYPTTGAQWWVHQSYVMIWFKQGLFGLLALLWVLFAATRTGIAGIRHEDPRVAGWFAASAACTVFAAIVGLTNYYFFMVTLSFLLALVWGITLAFARTSRRRFVWRAAPPPGHGEDGA
jgi:hypothetical protein